MQQILKRLEIIKSAIAIENTEIIELQIAKLNALDIDDDTRVILELIANDDYANALSAIEAHLARYSGVTVYIDAKLQALKLELKSLESKLQELVEQKMEYLNSINEFTTRYNLRLGNFIRSILELRKEILYKKSQKSCKKKEELEKEKLYIDESKQTADKMRATMNELEEVLANIDEDDENYDELNETYEELKEQLETLENEIKTKEEKLKKAKEELENSDEYREYEEAKSAYEEYDSSYEYIKEGQKKFDELSHEEKLELKKLYKKAARLCHPDIAPDELKERAHEMMQKLNEAYSKLDLTAISAILLALESGSGFEFLNDSINDKELLKAKIQEYKRHIQTTQDEIEEIRQDETYLLVSTLEDWDEYLEELRAELEKEENELKDESRAVLEDSEEAKEEIEEWMQAIWDWADENNIPDNIVSRNKAMLLDTEEFDFSGYSLYSLPRGLKNLIHLQSLILWDCDMKWLPEDIVELDLKTLFLSGNPDLEITDSQKEWIEYIDRNRIISNDEITDTDDDLYPAIKSKQQSNIRMPLMSIKFDGLLIDFHDIKKLEIINEELYIILRNGEHKLIYQYSLELEAFEDKELYESVLNNPLAAVVLITNDGLLKAYPKDSDEYRELTKGISYETVEKIEIYDFDEEDVYYSQVDAENSSYSKHILAIENPNFEKIRRYCQNLADDNQADTMQTYLAENGKMHKALVYDALEQFIERLDGKSITLVDWGSNQGIASMLVFDYIREKQLDITVEKLFLLGGNILRASENTTALRQENTTIFASNMVTKEFYIEEELNSNDIYVLKEFNNSISDNLLHLFVNAYGGVGFYEYDWYDFDFKIYNGHFLCVSNEQKEVEDIAMHLPPNVDGTLEYISIRDNKIGRYQRYERIFKIDRQ